MSQARFEAKCFAQKVRFGEASSLGPLCISAFSAFNCLFYAEPAKIHRGPQGKRIRYATFVQSCNQAQNTKYKALYKALSTKHKVQSTKYKALLPIQIIKPHTRGREPQIHRSGWTIALLCDDQLRDVLSILRHRLAFVGSFVLLLAKDERHQVRVLFKRPRFAQVS